MDKPKLEFLKIEKQAPHDWALNYPEQWEFLGHKFDKAEAALENGDRDEAKLVCAEILGMCPEYLPAINRLGLLLREEGHIDGAIQMFQSAVGMGLATLPDDFEIGTDRMPWYWEDNRAFLLAGEHLAISYLMKALDSLELSLNLNPGYHGIADMVAKIRGLWPFDDA